ncbi:OB-fold nucleic acid binding domain-containing protein, partial [Candidatus Bathyarchaeota archaeon]|nr:OB-fold nucleic acid binding domain-containing protein [Candidatus Bathyarchaeota archaeon]
MTKKDEIVQKILQTIPDLTLDVVEKRISGKKSEVGKLLTDEGAAYMVANELGIDLSGEKTLKTKITIKDITAGASDVTVTGKVVTIYQVRSFNRSNGVEGKVARAVIGDETGTVNIVLWDDKAEIIEKKLSEGDVICVNNGYVRAGLDGRPEINVGRKGTIVILPPELSSEVSKNVEEVYSKIPEIIEGESINFAGFIEKTSTVSTFQRSDGREGKVARARLNDKEGNITAVFWDEKTDLIQQVHRGDSVKIMNGYVRKGLTGDLEIHVRRGTEVYVQQIERSEET